MHKAWRHRRAGRAESESWGPARPLSGARDVSNTPNGAQPSGAVARTRRANDRTLHALARARRADRPRIPVEPWMVGALGSAAGASSASLQACTGASEGGAHRILCAALDEHRNVQAGRSGGWSAIAEEADLIDALWSSVEGLVNRLFRDNTRRTDPLPSPFPAAWQATLEREVPFYSRMPRDEDRSQLRSDIFRFVDDKTWTPFDVDIDERKKLIIAAHACLLLNGRIDLPVYPRTREIILRSGVFGPRTQSIAPDGRLFESHEARIGEAWYRGPIVLSWGAIEPLTIAPHPAHNVILHEFAHALDHLDGHSDGTPPLESRRALAEWAEVFSREFERLRNAAEGLQSNIIDPYGATNAPEFFAVVTEAFFCRATMLNRQHPELFEQMRLFFRQDPSGWTK